MDMIDLSKLRIYLNNKAASNITDLTIQINEGTLPFARVKLTQRFPSDGLFQSGVKEVVTDCVLENWRDQVLRLRTISKDGAVAEDEETQEILPKETEEDAGESEGAA